MQPSREDSRRSKLDSTRDKASRRKLLVRSQRDSQVKIRTAPVKSADDSCGAENPIVDGSSNDMSPVDCEEELSRLRQELEQAKCRAEKQRSLAKKLAVERDDLERQLRATRNNASDQRMIAQEMKTATEHLKQFAKEAVAERDRLRDEARLAEKDDLLWKLQVTNKWS